MAPGSCFALRGLVIATYNSTADKVRAVFKACRKVTATPEAAAYLAEHEMLVALTEHGKQDACQQTYVLEHLQALDEICASIADAPDFRGNAKLQRAYEKMRAETCEVFFSRALPALVKLRASLWQENY
jgi:hypothetical protein